MMESAAEISPIDGFACVFLTGATVQGPTFPAITPKIPEPTTVAVNAQNAPFQEITTDPSRVVTGHHRQISQIGTADAGRETTPAERRMMITTTKMPTLKPMFWQPLQSPQSRTPNVKFDNPSPAQYDRQIHGHEAAYVACFAKEGTAAFHERIDQLLAFADSNGMQGPPFSRELEALRQQVTGHLKGSIHQIPLHTLYSLTLERIDSIVDFLHDTKLPLKVRQSVLRDMCYGLDKCAGGISNLIERAAVKAEFTRMGLPGKVAQYKSMVVSDIAFQLIKEARVGAGDETHWEKALHRALTQEYGLPPLSRDLTVNFDEIDAPTRVKAKAMLETACNPADLIDQFASEIHAHVRSAFTEEVQRLRGARSIAASSQVHLTMDEAHAFCMRMENEVKANFQIEYPAFQVLRQFLREHEDPGGDMCLNHFTPNEDRCLVNCHVRDALAEAGLITFNHVTLDRFSDGGEVKFDGCNFYVETPFRRRTLTPLELKRYQPEEFGALARALVLSVIKGSDAQSLANLPQKWLLDSRVRNAWIENAPTAMLPDWLPSPAAKALLAQLSPDEKKEMVVALARNLVPAKALVENGWIDPRGPMDEILAALVANGCDSQVKELLLAFGVRRPFIQLTSGPWEGNPASQALFQGNEALLLLLEKAGWSHHPLTVNRAVSRRLLGNAIVDAGSLHGMALALKRGLTGRDSPVDACHRAAAIGDTKMLSLLLRRLPAGALVANPSPLLMAISKGGVEMTIMLAKAICETPEGRAEFLRIINGSRAVKIVDGIRKPICLLEHAIGSNRVELANFLLQSGALLENGTFNAVQDALEAGPAMLDMVMKFQDARTREMERQASARAQNA